MLREPAWNQHAINTWRAILRHNPPEQEGGLGQDITQRLAYDRRPPAYAEVALAVASDKAPANTPDPPRPRA